MFVKHFLLPCGQIVTYNITDRTEICEDEINSVSSKSGKSWKTADSLPVIRYAVIPPTVPPSAKPSGPAITPPMKLHTPHTIAPLPLCFNVTRILWLSARIATPSKNSCRSTGIFFNFPRTTNDSMTKINLENYSLTRLSRIFDLNTKKWTLDKDHVSATKLNCQLAPKLRTIA